MPSKLIISSLMLSILLIFMQFIQQDVLFLRANIQQGEVWRLWSGNLVHSNYYHLGLNLAGFWLFIFIFKDSINSLQLSIALFLLITGVGLGLYYLTPQLQWYAGISGALYGLFIIGATYTLLEKDFITSIPILIAIPAKIAWDYKYGTGQDNADLIGVPVSVESHIFGISSAFILSIIIIAWHFYTHNKLAH